MLWTVWLNPEIIDATQTENLPSLSQSYKGMDIESLKYFTSKKSVNTFFFGKEMKMLG